MFASFFRNAALILSLALAQSATAQTTVTLMNGLNGYAGTTDAWLWAASPDTNKEGQGLELRAETQDSAVIRFAIFASEGGPVPNGAAITSATLSLYKWNGPDGVFKASRLLKNWNESQVTWNNAASASPWTSPGAMSAGNDYLAAADGQGSVGDAAANGCGASPYPAACWLNIDVTSGVQAFAGGTPNYGWKLALVSSSGSSYKAFNDGENSGFPTLRPKLTITYVVGSIVTLMNGLNSYVGTTDAWLWAASPNTNKEGQGLELRAETQDSAVIRFAIFASEGGPVPNGSTIHSATLSLYKWNGPDGVFKASRLLKNWDESQVTWNNAATGAPWTSPGAMSAGNDYLGTADGQGSVGDAAANGCGSAPYPAACWLNIDVTSGVQAFGSGTANYGWKLALVSSSGSSYKAFNDGENSGFPTLRPKLTVNYTPPDPCTVPTANFTWSQNPAGSLNVTFNASSSADGSYPITSLWLQFGDGQDVTWNDKNQVQSHPYAAYTTYSATLVATNQCGPSAPKTLPVTPTPGGVPTASYTWSQNPGTSNVTFNASGSADGGSQITSLHLRFGHGNPEEDVTWYDKLVPQTHTFPGPGTYTVVLTATNSFGPSAEHSQQIQVTDGTDNPPTTQPAGNLGFAVATFHSMGLYYNPASTPANCTTTDGSGCKVWMRYRKASEPNTAWHEGYPLWFDPRTSGNSLPYTKNGLPYRARGSAVLLQPGTKYYFEFGTGTSFTGAAWQHYVSGTTWSETFPVGTTMAIPNGSPECPAQGPCVISQNGTSTAYKVYDGCQVYNGSICVTKGVIDRAGAGLDAGPNPSHDSIMEGYVGTQAHQYKDPSFGIVIKGSYIIVRNVVVKGAAAAGILIYPNVTDVIIEDSEVVDWSWRKGTTFDGGPNCSSENCRELDNPNTWGTWGVNEGGGIHLAGNNSRIVIQRNIIKDPHYGAFPWDTHPAEYCSSANGPNDHPIGPMGISIQNAAEQNVIRYNEITGHASNDRRWLLDGIGGGDNFGPQGVPGADSDIYQNIVMRSFDDAIEADGGGRNVRIWGNYLSDVKVAVSGTTEHFGPWYVWRNVINRMRTCYKSITNTDNDWLSTAFKLGGINNSYGHGARYLFHNTFLQELVGAAGEGAGRGTEGISNGGGSVTWTTARNNVFHVRSTDAWSVESEMDPTGSDFAFNLYNGRYDSSLPAPDLAFKFTESELFYKPGHGSSSVPVLGGGGTGNYQLAAGSKGQDTWGASKKCEVVANFSDGYIGSAPDCGAHENGAPPMKFGISATP